MMKIRHQMGQALIFVLILLAVGGLLIVPALRLTGTALMTSGVTDKKIREVYAADSGQEYIIWKLLYQNFAASFNNTYNVPIIVDLNMCGIPVRMSVIMRAVASWRGVTLIGNTPIKPTKTVTPNTNPGGSILTYTIKLEQISDNTSQGLDAVYDILPQDFVTGDYISNSANISVDGGPPQPLGNPLIELFGNVRRLRWPASGNFTSPIRDFAGGQVKEIKFQMASGNLKTNKTYYNWVVLKPWNILSGATATIVTGTGAGSVGGIIDVATTASPALVPPGVPTDIRYTITIKNQQGSTDQIQKITDYLPPGFVYIGPVSGLTTIAPVATYGPVNGVDRWKLEWTKTQFPGGNDISIASGAQTSLTFWARTSENVSGSYYNEVTVQMKNPIPTEFSSLNITQNDFNTGYTWNSAVVIVPAFDSRSSAGNTTVDANLGFTPGSVTIISWNLH